MTLAEILEFLFSLHSPYWSVWPLLIWLPDSFQIVPLKELRKPLCLSKIRGSSVPKKQSYICGRKCKGNTFDHNQSFTEKNNRKTACRIKYKNRWRSIIFFIFCFQKICKLLHLKGNNYFKNCCKLVYYTCICCIWIFTHMISIHMHIYTYTLQMHIHYGSSSVVKVTFNCLCIFTVV